MLISRALNRLAFSTITQIRGSIWCLNLGSEFKNDDNVELRGLRIQSTAKDSPNLIFIPEAFDQA